MTFEFDTSRLQRSMRTYQLAAMKGSEAVVRDAARNFIKKAASITPPAIGKLNSTAKKIGERSIIGDINSILVGVPPGIFKKLEAIRARGTGVIRTKSGTLVVKAADITVPSIKGWHYAHRRRNGRVRGGKNRTAAVRAIVLAAQKKSYTAGVLRKVGLLMAGWNASAEKLGTKLPAWVTRHGSGGGRCAVNTRNGIHIRMENMRGFIGRVGGLKRRVQWALDAQANALDRAARAIMVKAARRAGFR